MFKSVEYQVLNNISIKEHLPLLLINEVLESLSGARIFSKLDRHAGYHEVLIDEKDLPKTAFVTQHGKYAWRVIPIGITQASSTYQKLMNTVARLFLDKSALVYLDSIIICLRTLYVRCLYRESTHSKKEIALRSLS